MLDVDGDGKVSLHDMRDAVIQIYNERKNLAFTLKDTWTVVGKLEFVIGISIHLLFGFFYLLIFEVHSLAACQHDLDPSTKRFSDTSTRALQVFWQYFRTSWCCRPS